MTNQMFLVPRVDEKATRASVKAAFEQYHDHKRTLALLEATIPSIGAFRGGPSDASTAFYPENDADAIRGSSKRPTAFQEVSEAIERLNRRQEAIDAMVAFVEAVEVAVSRLVGYEAEVIDRTLMKEKAYRKKDSVIWPEMSLTKNAFYDHKEKAMLRIAFALRIEVYEEEEEEEEGAQVA